VQRNRARKNFFLVFIEPALQKRKKKKLKKFIWLAADLAVLGILLALLFYKPAGYRPVDIKPTKKVSKYLTNVLYPEIYNRAQLGKPYDVTLTQKGANDIVAHSSWPKYAAGAIVSKPQVKFEPQRIVFRGTVTLKSMDFIVTIALKTSFTEKGLLNLNLAQIKVGALNVTPLAKIIAGRMYRKQTAGTEIDPENWGVKLTASLLQNEPFEPVLEVKDVFAEGDTKVRIQNITIQNEKLIFHLIPLPEPNS